MPVLEPTILSSEAYTLRHVGPLAQLWPTSPPVAVTEYTLLNRTDLVARPIADPNVPGSGTFDSGYWTGRLYDSGEFQITFPNAAGLQPTDGLPWRSRFDPGQQGLRNQWIECYRNNELEFVGCIEKVQIDQGNVTISGHDGFYYLKNAYERDLTVVWSPNDVIRRATQLWVPLAADDFPVGSSISGSTLTTPYTTWTISTTGGSTVTLPAGGGVLLTVPAGLNNLASLTSPLQAASTAWRATATVQTSNFPSTFPGTVDLTVFDQTGGWYHVGFEPSNDIATLRSSYYHGAPSGITGVAGQTTITSATTYNLLIECDGEWITAYINQQLIGQARVQTLFTQLQTSLQLKDTATGSGTATVTFTQVFVETLQPFL